MRFETSATTHQIGTALHQFFAWSMIALVVASFSTFLLGIRGGFDFTDEGAYYLSFAHPEHVSDRQTTYFLFGGMLFSLSGENLIAMRIAALLATLGGAAILAHGLGRFLTAFAPSLATEPVDRRSLTASALVASFLGYAISPPALSYNIQNAFCLMAATGFLMRATAAPRSDFFLSAGSMGNLAAFVGIVSLEFFVKFSSSLPLAVIGIGFFLVFSRQSIRQKLALTACGLVGCTLLAAAYFAFIMDFATWRAGIAGTLGALIHGTVLSERFGEYGGDFVGLAVTLCSNFIPVWIIAVPAAPAVLLLWKWPRIQRYVAAGAAVWTLGHFIWVVNYFEYHRQASVTVSVVCLAILAFWVIASRFTRQRGSSEPVNWSMLGAGVLLFVLPYIGALGTDNDLNNNALYQIAPWSLLIAVLCSCLDYTWQSRWVTLTVLPLLALVTTTQFYRGFWQEPYRVAGGRSEQTVATAIGFPSTTLRLNPAANAFIEDTRQILTEHGFKPGDDLIVFFDMPGWVFAMGGVSPVHPWFFGGSTDGNELNLMRLRMIEEGRRKRAFVIRHGDWKELVSRLPEVGIRISEEYDLISPPLLSPFTQLPFEIWRPRARVVPPSALAQD